MMSFFRAYIKGVIVLTIFILEFILSDIFGPKNFLLCI